MSVCISNVFREIFRDVLEIFICKVFLKSVINNYKMLILRNGKYTIDSTSTYTQCHLLPHMRKFNPVPLK